MNTLQNIYDKLNSKTELAKHEVNLAAMEDLIKATAEVERWSMAFNKTNEKLIAEAKLAVTQADNFNNGMEKMQDLMTPLKKQFADLGLNYLDNAVVKIASGLLNKSFNIQQQAGYIKQIIK